MLTKIFIIIALVVIVASLFSALAGLFRQEGQNQRVVRALTLRISLSIGLFVLLLAGFYFGLIPTHGLR